MNFEPLSTEAGPDLADRYTHRIIGVGRVMEARARRSPSVKKRPQIPVIINRTKSLPSSYFSGESFLVLLCLTISLLILPLVLPPLPPPPVLLLLLPIGMLVVLIVMAFMPSNVRDIASSYL